MYKKTAEMSISETIAQIASIKANSQSFIREGESDKIWHDDVLACESAISILSALEDIGINTYEQVRKLIAKATGQKLQYCTQCCTVVASQVDAQSGSDQMLDCLGVFADMEKAYGAALLYLDEIAENETKEKEKLMITTIIELEGETGYGVYLKDKDGNDLYRTYILFADRIEGGGA